MNLAGGGEARHCFRRGLNETGTQLLRVSKVKWVWGKGVVATGGLKKTSLGGGIN